jgi:hypothetical protein
MTPNSRNVLLSSALAALALIACGKKGDPLPPLSLAPPPAKDFALAQRGGILFAELAYPDRTASGLALPGLDAVELWRIDEPPSTTPAEQRPLPTAKEFDGLARMALRVTGSELTSSVQGDRIVLRLPGAAAVDPALGRAVYATRTVAQGGDRSALSNLVAFVPIASPAPPASFALASRADGVEVTWAAVPQAAGYHVYRRDASARGFGRPIHAAGAEATSFVDASAAFGRRYVYTVSTVARPTPLVESAPTAERELDRQDRFGPPAPTRLVALPDAGAAKLLWEASPGDDVAGYAVYRQDPGQGFRRITAETVTALEFQDRGLVARLTYRYRVAAIDRVGNVGEPTEPVDVTVR